MYLTRDRKLPSFYTLNSSVHSGECTVHSAAIKPMNTIMSAKTTIFILFSLKDIIAIFSPETLTSLKPSPCLPFCRRIFCSSKLRWKPHVSDACPLAGTARSSGPSWSCLLSTSPATSPSRNLLLVKAAMEALRFRRVVHRLGQQGAQVLRGAACHLPVRLHLRQGIFCLPKLRWTNCIIKI
jgi:hypothetical protein